MQAFVPDGSLNLLIYVLPPEALSGKSHRSTRPPQRGSPPFSSERRHAARTGAQTLLIVPSIDKSFRWITDFPPLHESSPIWVWDICGGSRMRAALGLCPSAQQIPTSSDTSRLKASDSLNNIFIITPPPHEQANLNEKKMLWGYHWVSASLKWRWRHRAYFVILPTALQPKWLLQRVSGPIEQLPDHFLILWYFVLRMTQVSFKCKKA